jgi:hypothetical protein
VYGVALFFRAAAQEPVSSKEPALATLEGMVVKDPGGEPLKKAIIELIGENQEESGNYTATSDAEGHYKVTAIQPGRYRFMVERTGYLEAHGKDRYYMGVTLSFRAGQEVKDQVVHMVPGAVVSGRVLDEDGDPMPNVSITLYRRKRTAGGMTFEFDGHGQTDDLGEYRVRGLHPGKYYVLASPLPSFQSFVEEHKKPNDPAAPSANLAYVPIFYPNTTDRSAASPIELHAGDEMPVDFSLVRSHTVNIRGTVEGASSDTRAVVLLRGTDPGSNFDSADVGKDGKFEIQHVSPGSYTLAALTVLSDNTRAVHRTIEVGESDINDLRLSPQPGATLRGQVHFPKSLRADSSLVMLELRPRERNDEFINSMIFSNDESYNIRTNVRLKPDGSFEVRNVPAGLYDVYLGSETRNFVDTFIESVIAGMKDVVDTGLDVSGGTISLDITISNEPGVIDGVVTNDKGEAIPNATVVAVPDPKLRKNLYRYYPTATDQAGHFVLRGIRPGEYKLLAWTGLDGDEYFDPDFLTPFESRGTVAKVEKGTHQTVPLKVIPAPQDQQ